MEVIRPESSGPPRRREPVAPHSRLAFKTGEHLPAAPPLAAPPPVGRPTSEGPQPSPTRVRAYIAALTVAAIVAGAALVLYGPAVSPHDLIVAAALAVIAIAAETLNYRRTTGGSGSVGHIPMLALVLLVPAWPALVAAMLPFIAVAIAQRRPVERALFNASQVALAAAAAVLAYLACGGAPLESLPRDALLTPRIALAALAADAAFVLVNTSAVSAVLALSSGRRFVQVWRESSLATASYYLFSAPFAGALAWLVGHTNFVAAAAFMLPILGVRQLYHTTYALFQTTQELLELMVSAIEARDPYTSGHSRRVAAMAVVVAQAAGLPERAVKRIHVAGLLHDVGKIHTKYAAILQKPDRLTRDEWVLMQQHPADGEVLVRKVSQLHDVLPGVRHHHEKWDGTGYPDGLVGEAIPLQARILAVADTVDAMTSDRPYRPGLSKDEVYQELRLWSGKQFDPHIVAKLLDTPFFDRMFEAAKTADSRNELALVRPTPPPAPKLRTGS